ncbi:transforming growth factor, beta receptor associated protein 1 [Actinomortierella wolfii]|nr:transforming growth factor, beta receptor associated protein 1 [Actinomortierella wolfii]
MHNTFTVQPLLKGVPLDDGAFEGSAPSGFRSFIDRQSNTPSGTGSPSGGRSTGIFNRARPVVESLDTFENNLYIGTSDGYLLHYIVDEQISADMDIPQSQLVSRTPLGFGKKIVEQIKVLAAIRVAIVLCDSTVSFYSLPDFAPYPQQAMPHIKGVTTFAIDESQKGIPLEDGSFRLCVTKRRIIQFYYLWYDGISEPRDLSLPNGSLSTIRWGSHVCFADSQDFGLIDVRAGRMISVLPVSQGRSGTGHHAGVVKPVCAAIGENEFLMASATGSGQTTIGIFCSASGDPVRGTLQWSSYPRMLGVEFPYVAALLRNNTVEIHNILDQKLVQVVRFDASMEARALVQTPGLPVWVAALSHVLATRTKPPEDAQEQAGQLEHALRLATVPARLLIAGKDGVSALVITPLVLKADMLLHQGRIEEAILLSEKALSTISADNLHRERLSHEVNYVNQKAGFIYLGETLFDDAFALFEKGNIDPRILIYLFEDVLQEPDMLDHVDVYQGVRDALTRIGSIQKLIARTMAKGGNEQDAEFSNMLLANAKDVFTNSLTKFRRRNSGRKLPPNMVEAVQAVDTALLGIWVDNRNTKELYALLSGHNECIPHLSDPKLQQSSMHYALSLWHRTRGNHRETLRIWKALQQGEIQDADFSNGLHQMADLLSTTTDLDIIHEFAWWILEQSEQLGLRIFMPSDPKRAALFDTEQVLAQLETKASQEGVVWYLEYLVYQRKSDKSDHHSKLALWYIKMLEDELRIADKALLQEQIAKDYLKEQQRILLNADVASSRMNKDKHTILGRTFLNFLQGQIASKGPDRVTQQRIKLLQLLLSSSRYQSSTILPRLESIPCLLAERGVVLGQTGQHKACVRILVHDLGDFLSVEQFCANAGMFSVAKKISTKTLTSSSATIKKKERDEAAVKGDVESLAVHQSDTQDIKQTLFMLLLREYLEIPYEHQRMVLVLHLLDTQAIYLDVAEVLDLLPPVWSIDMVQQFFIRSLRSSQHEHRELQIIKGMTLGDNLMVSEQLYKTYEEIGPVVVTAETVCAFCKNAVGDVVFMRTADGHIAHLHCGP